MKTRNILAGIGLAAALGCGNGYSVNNYEPEQEDVVQTADGSYTPSDAGNDSNSWRPTGPYGNVPGPRVPRGPFGPVIEVPDDSTQFMQGIAVYCIHENKCGSTHIGTYVDALLADTDGLNEIGINVYGETERDRFHRYANGAQEFAYRLFKQNFGEHGAVDALTLYAIDENGEKTEFAMGQINCDTLESWIRNSRHEEDN